MHRVPSVPIAATLCAGVLALHAACGGSTSTLHQTPPGDDLGDDLGDDFGGEAGTGDGGCIDPTEGAACTSKQVACQPSDPCCAGYVWSCTGSPETWQKLGLGCTCQIDAGVDAGPFACGSATCAGGQFCEVQPPGIAAPDGGTLPTGYDCVPVPPACAASPTCGCIESTLSPSDTCSTATPGVSCTADGEGHVIIDCIGE